MIRLAGGAYEAGILAPVWPWAHWVIWASHLWFVWFTGDTWITLQLDTSWQPVQMLHNSFFFFFWFKFLFPSHSWALCREISQNRGSGGTLKLEANPDVRASPSLSYKPHVSADRSFAHAKFYSHLICFYTSTGRNGFLLKKIKRKKEKRNNEIMTMLVKQPLVRDLNCGCSLLTVNTAVVLSVHFLA